MQRSVKVAPPSADRALTQMCVTARVSLTSIDAALDGGLRAAGCGWQRLAAASPAIPAWPTTATAGGSPPPNASVRPVKILLIIGC